MKFYLGHDFFIKLKLIFEYKFWNNTLTNLGKNGNKTNIDNNGVYH
jgi:hypothetical protein